MRTTDRDNLRRAAGSNIQFTRVVRCLRWRTASGMRRQASKAFGLRLSAHWRAPDGDRMSLEDIRREGAKVADRWLETARAVLDDWREAGTLGERRSSDLHRAVRERIGPQYWRLPVPKRLPRTSLLNTPSTKRRTKVRVGLGLTKVQLDKPRGQ